MDGKIERTVQFDPAKMRHFDHGYAVTSHVSQGLTEGRVIANIDTDTARSLISTRLAYVAISRAEHDARIYTNDADGLGARLATNISKTSAVDFRQSSPEPAPQKDTMAQVPRVCRPESPASQRSPLPTQSTLATPSSSLKTRQSGGN